MGGECLHKKNEYIGQNTPRETCLKRDIIVVVILLNMQISSESQTELIDFNT